MSADQQEALFWEEKPLGSLCDLTNGYPFKPSDWGRLGKPIIRIQNLNGGQEFNFFRGTLPERYEVEPGTLLFAWSGNRGTSFGPYIWEGPKGLLNQHIFKVKTAEGIDRTWFYYALDEVRQRVERNAHGAIGLVHVRKQDLRKYNVIVPVDVGEQCAIAIILGTVDEAIRRTEALIEKLRRMKAGLLYDLVTHGLDENGELRDPMHHPEQFKDSPLGRIPKDWGIESLEKLTKAPICYGILQPGPYVAQGIPMVAIKDLHGDFHDGIHRVSPRLDSLYARSRITGGDVLLSIKGTTGRLDVAPPSFQGNISRDLARLRPCSRISPDFLRCFLTSPVGQSSLKNTEVGTTRSEISITRLKKVLVTFAPREEQDLVLWPISSVTYFYAANLCSFS